MRYLCTKQLTAGGVEYHPGEIIPDGIILPERSGKLLKSGYISEIDTEPKICEGVETLYTKEEVANMVAEAVAEAEKKKADQLAELQEYVAELEETEPDAYDGMVQIAVKGASDEQCTAIPARSEEIQQVFSIMQLSAEEGVRAIADVTSENVLILLHAADSRKTVKNAAKEQADKLFSPERVSNESGNGNETTNTNTEGADT